MLKNRDRLADDIKNNLHSRNINIKKSDVLSVLSELENVIESSLKSGYDVKIGSLIKLSRQSRKNIKRYDGLNKRYFLTSTDKVVIKKLKRLTDLEAKR